MAAGGEDKLDGLASPYHMKAQQNESKPSRRHLWHTAEGVRTHS